MTTNNGRLSPHLGDSRADTSHAVALRHAASVRPCGANLRGQKKANRTRDGNVGMLLSKLLPAIDPAISERNTDESNVSLWF